MRFRTVALLLLCAVSTRSRGAQSITPSACISLSAFIATADGETINPADETRLDTVRLQNALDRCGAGMTVRLQSSPGDRNVFLSGPLRFPTGVTLAIDRNVILMASRDARDFQVKQGSCGVVDKGGQGCHALISCSTGGHAALVGEGAINGRGSSAILGETYSWWDLRQEARLKNGKLNAPDLIDAQTCRGLKLTGLTVKNSPMRN